MTEDNCRSYGSKPNTIGGLVKLCTFQVKLQALTIKCSLQRRTNPKYKFSRCVEWLAYRGFSIFFFGGGGVVVCRGVLKFVITCCSLQDFVSDWYTRESHWAMEPHVGSEVNFPTCGFIAQLVEHRTGIAEVRGSNPVEALIFSGFFFPIA